MSHSALISNPLALSIALSSEGNSFTFDNAFAQHRRFPCCGLKGFDEDDLSMIAQQQRALAAFYNTMVKRFRDRL